MTDHAAVIREQIDTGHYGYCQMVGRGACTCGQADRLAAVAALDALQADLEAVGRAHDELGEYTLKLQEQIAALETERDEWKREAQAQADLRDEAEERCRGFEVEADAVQRLQATLTRYREEREQGCGEVDGKTWLDDAQALKEAAEHIGGRYPGAASLMRRAATRLYQCCGTPKAEKP